MKNRCVIVAGGDCCKDDLLLLCDTDYIIAADSGLKILLENGIEPQLLVGDFDSYNGQIPEGFEVIRLPEHKDDTDLLFAARTGVEKGFKNFVVLGGYGSRPDQNLAMYSTLLWLVTQHEGVTAAAISKKFSATVLFESTIDLQVGDDEYFSVFSLGGNAAGVNIINADYPLNNATLTPEFPIGVSNAKANGGKVTISVKTGSLLIFKLKKNI